MTAPPPPHGPVADPYAGAPGAPLGGAYPQTPRRRTSPELPKTSARCRWAT